LAIIDDDQAIKFLKRNFPRTEHKITRTVGFMEECYRRKIFSKEETINILELIKKSKFRVKKAIIEDIIKRISEGF
jgi:predicted nucleic acid-binding protein